MKMKLPLPVISMVAMSLVRLYFTTIRIFDDPHSRRYRQGARGVDRIYAFWHAQGLSCAWHYRHRGGTALVSRSRDGVYIGAAARSLGYYCVRGSSSRGGGRALLALLARITGGDRVVMSPDGPHGPRHEVKEGTLFLAQKSGLPIQPIAVGYSGRWELPTWDRYRVPKPFAIGYAMWGELIRVPPEMTEEERAAILRRLEQALNELEAAADEKARRLKHGRRPKRQGRTGATVAEIISVTGMK